MQLIESAQEMRETAEAIRKRKRIAFVPTMGALHAGHAALFKEAGRHGEFRIASLFVNPTQFNQPDDFEKYPRTLPADLEICRSEGVDIVFAPTPREIYPDGLKRNISVPRVGLPMEGELRPGHFAGVCTVVHRLFRIIQPHAALFGEKDYQQLLVVREMVAEQQLPVEVIGHPTVRDPNGLALSSRNLRLSAKGLKRALAIPQAIQAVRALYQKGERETERLIGAAKKILMGLTTDYVTVADATSLKPLKNADENARLFIAAWIEGVRLIDNALLYPLASAASNK